MPLCPRAHFVPLYAHCVCLPRFLQQALPPFYEIIMVGCKHDAYFCESILRHRNWDWAVVHMYFSSEDYKAVC